MKDENEVRSPDQIIPHVLVASSENVMDLSDLWNMLVRWKAIVIGVAFVTFIAIVANEFLNAPVPLYKASAYLSLPSESDIEGFQREGYPQGKFFSAFVQNLKSRALRLRYFNENKLLDKLVLDGNSDAEQVFEERFNKMFHVTRQGDHVYVNFDAANAELATEWVNGFVTLANEATVRAFLDAKISSQNKQESEIESKMNVLRKDIADKRKKAKREREDQIIRLEEMALIAERIGINDVILTSNRFKQIPHYMRGAKALHAEAEVLRERKSDDPFIKGIRDLQSQLAFLQSEVDKSKFARSDSPHVSTMQVRQMATVPSRPFNLPVFKWIMLTGMLGALILGVLAAFLADFIVRAREKEAMSSGQKLAG